MRTLWLAALFLAPAHLLAQTGTAPTSGAFTVTTTPTKDGFRATADLPNGQHKRNVGGSDGAGLCVYTAAWHAALWQSASELYGFRDWMRARPGGSYPQKFAETLNAYCREKGIPCPGYVQHTGGDVEFLKLALKTGRMVCVTYCGVDGAGRYGSEVIGHMVNLLYLDEERACILDNNFPGTFLWMSAADFLARWRGVKIDGSAYMGRDKWGRTFPIGGGWAIALLAAPPAPYPDAPAVQSSRGPCNCEKCECADRGKCPATCPVLVGQCPGGRCPVPLQTVPSLPNPFGPVYPSGDPIPDQMPAEQLPIPNRQPTARDLAARPTPDYLWRDTPGVGVGWILPDPQHDWGRTTTGWGWVKKAQPIEAAPVGSTNDFPQGGVMPEQLTTQERYWRSGAPCTKAEAISALSLADDSQRWNLAIVGEPSFARKVRDDVAALPAAIRDRLHVQSYAPGDWQAAQFKLTPGVTLRKPAVGRVGADLGTLPTTDYSAATLADLLTVSAGPNPKPTPAPVPKPKDTPEVKPTPDVKPAPTPAPARAVVVPVWAIGLIIAALAVAVIRR